MGGVRRGRRGRARERAVAGWCARADSSFRFLKCCLNSEMLRLPEPSSSYLCRAAGGGGVRPCRGGGRDRGGCSCSSSDKCAGGAAARRRGGAWRRGGVAVRCGVAVRGCGALFEEVKQDQDLLFRVPARRPQRRWSACGFRAVVRRSVWPRCRAWAHFALLVFGFSASASCWRASFSSATLILATRSSSFFRMSASRFASRSALFWAGVVAPPAPALARSRSLFSRAFSFASIAASRFWSRSAPAPLNGFTTLPPWSSTRPYGMRARVRSLAARCLSARRAKR